MPLCQIDKKDRLAEIEFLYPESGEPGVAERFITGFMDLLFRKDERYYLLDWKTNLLPAYTREQIERSMADPIIAGNISFTCRRRRAGWARPRAELPFLERFAGVFYLYVRGLNGRDDKQRRLFPSPDGCATWIWVVLRS